MRADDYIFAQINRSVMEEIKHSASGENYVNEAVKIFYSSLEQVDHMHSLPGWIAGATSDLGKCWAQACVEETGQHDWKPSSSLKDKITHKKIVARHHASYSEMKKDILFDLGDGIFTLLHTDFMNQDAPLSSGYKAIIKSMYVYSWAAFEVLVTALYKGATSKTPRGFHSAQTFYPAWRAEFATSQPKLFKAIKSHKIRRIWLIRNLIVHKAGMIDQDFIAECRKWKIRGVKELTQKPLNEEIPYDTNLFLKHNTEFLRAVLKLIKHFVTLEKKNRQGS